jgi:hypothetical protein
MTLTAYLDNPQIKTDILAQLEAHRQADQIIKGRYWENGKGCAVGCTIHSGDHAEYERCFGIPQMLARLEDTIFEGLPNRKAKDWPVRFMSAIRPGADLSRVGWQFLHWLLTDEKVNPGINHPLVREVVKQCADLLAPLMKGLPVAGRSARSAESAARSAESAESAARSAGSAAWSAAESAAWSAAGSAASAAARSAGSAAWSAAWSAAASAESAAGSAASVAESAAGSVAGSAAYVLMADQLVKLLEAA